MHGSPMGLARSGKVVDKKHVVGNYKFTLTPSALFSPSGSLLLCNDKSKLIYTPLKGWQQQKDKAMIHYTWKKPWWNSPCFDTYRKDSLKSNTKEKKGHDKDPIQYQVMRTSQHESFLSHDRTKTDLTDYFAIKIIVYNQDSSKVTSASGHTINIQQRHAVWCEQPWWGRHTDDQRNWKKYKCNVLLSLHWRSCAGNGQLWRTTA